VHHRVVTVESLWRNSVTRPAAGGSRLCNSIVGGSLIFDPDSQNPGDTGWVYANALLGNYGAFTQISNYEVASYHYNQFEWYGQDTWKVKPSLTLNYGIRFAITGPLYEENNLVSSFVPNAFNPSQAVMLYQPGCVGASPCSGANRVAVNPLTGATLPGGPQFGPRFGLDWTPGGANGKTVIRRGFGVFFERIQGNYMFYQITVRANSQRILQIAAKLYF
jgi:hypothetical protein